MRIPSNAWRRIFLTSANPGRCTLLPELQLRPKFFPLPLAVMIGTFFCRSSLRAVGAPPVVSAIPVAALNMISGTYDPGEATLHDGTLPQWPQERGPVLTIRP